MESARCRVTASICPNWSGIQTNAWNISKKKNNLSITINREVKQVYVVPINDDEFSLSWSPSTLNLGCMYFVTDIPTDVTGQWTLRKIEKGGEVGEQRHAGGGALGGTQYRKTVRKIGKYRNTVSKSTKYRYCIYFRSRLLKRCIHLAWNETKRETTSNWVGSTIEKDALPISS